MARVEVSVALLQGDDMSTIISSSPAPAATLGLVLRPNKQRRRLFLICSGSGSGSAKSEQSRGGIGRREASLAMSGFWLANIVVSVPAASQECTMSLTTTTPSGLAFCDLLLGSGSEPTKGQLIKAHYVGRFENGTVFDSSYNRGKPLTFRVGVGEVIQGWDQGILGSDGIPPMLPGGKRKLKIPPELAYGIRGAGCKAGSCIIPPNSTLLFDVEYIGKA